MHVRNLVYTGIAAAFSVAAAGAHAEGYWIEKATGTIECSGRTLTGGVPGSFNTTFPFAGVAGWGLQDSFAGVCFSEFGGGLAGIPAPYCYFGSFFPDSRNPAKGTMGVYANEWVYPTDRTYVETLQLKVLPPDKSGQTKLAGQSIAVLSPFSDSSTTADAMTATCDWKLQGFAEPYPY